MEKIVGLINAPFTPFYPNGEVNYELIPSYSAMLKKNGLKGVFINGSSGEGFLLTEDERMRLAEAWIAVAPKDFKVIVHCGSTCVKSSIQIAKHAQQIGAWGIGAMGPPFPHIGRIKELAKYCEEIAFGAPKLPFYYYHIPALSNVSQSMLELLKVVDGNIPNFAGIKYTYENLYEFNQCIKYQEGKFDLLHGQDETYLASVAMCGTKGGICGTTNYNAVVQTGIGKAWDLGNLIKARKLQDYSQAVINVICKYYGNIVAGKRIMRFLGLDMGNNRTPFPNLTDLENDALKKELDSIDFFNHCSKL